MAQRTYVQRLNRQDLVRQTSQAVQLPVEQTDQVVDAFLNVLTHVLSSGRSVTLSREGLGRFDVVHQDARRVMNPRTRQLMEIPSRYRVRFRASEALKNQLKEGQVR